MKEHIARIQECKYENVIVRWSVLSDHIRVTPSFFYSLYSFLPRCSKKAPYNHLATNGQVLSSIYNHYAKQTTQSLLSYIKQNEIKTIIPVFFKDHYHCSSLLLESCIFCPLTTFQTKCLQSLYYRYDYALQHLAGEHLSDIITTVTFELERINTHPLLAGCSDVFVGEKWCESFRKVSSKVIVCDKFIERMKSVLFVDLDNGLATTPFFLYLFKNSKVIRVSAEVLPRS